MKVGILTHPLGRNYGGILQAWALQQVVRNLGYEPQTIDWDYDIPKWKNFFRGLPGALRAKLLGRNVDWPPTPNWIPVKFRGLWKFVKRYMCLSPRISFSAIIPYITNHYSIVIVGSDQVWRALYIPKIETMFLPYSKNNKGRKIAYAASFGTDDWEYTDEETNACAKLISDFDAVSVREKSGIYLCTTKLRYANCLWVLDPTFLVDRAAYDNLCSDSEKDNNGYLFAYILDQNNSLLSLAKLKAAEMNLRLKVVSADEDVKPTDTVEKWVAAFRDAKYVITDSFHGTVFSLIYHKEFAVYRNKTRGNARFDSLMQLFPQINGRIIEENRLPNSKIDWSSIENTCKAYKQDSIEFLKNALL